MSDQTASESGSEQAAFIHWHVTSNSRLCERIAIQECSDPSDPRYAKRTRQLLEQLDEYPPKTPCLVVSIAELKALLGLVHGATSSGEVTDAK